jgi:peptide/nickel transport system substrate-binding protein
VTTEDVRFAWEDIRGNEKIYPIFPSASRPGFRPQGKPGVLEIVDDFTFTVTFDAPTALSCAT